MLDMALWPQAFMLTLTLKAIGSDTWESFKASRGHLLEGLPMTILPSGVKSAHATAMSPQALPSAMLSGGRSLQGAKGPRARMSARSGRVPAASAADAGAAEPDTVAADDAEPLGVSEKHGIVAMSVCALLADVAYGYYFVGDTEELALGLWGESYPMWAGSFLKIFASSAIAVAECLKHGAESSNPIIVYNAIVVAGVLCKLVFRYRATPESKPEARKRALFMTALANVLGIFEYTMVSRATTNNFDLGLLFTQLASLGYVLIQAYVATREWPQGIKALTLAEQAPVWAATAIAFATKVGVDIDRIGEACDL